jgi:hypothetical protein
MAIETGLNFEPKFFPSSQEKNGHMVKEAKLQTQNKHTPRNQMKTLTK